MTSRAICSMSQLASPSKLSFLVNMPLFYRWPQKIKLPCWNKKQQITSYKIHCYYCRLIYVILDVNLDELWSVDRSYFPLNEYK